MRSALVAALAVSISVLAPATPARAQACDITEFPGSDHTEASPWAQGLIERMPDGSMWFGEGASIARADMKGRITKFATSPPGVSNDVAAGPDGNYWFTEIIGDKIGKISPRPPYSMVEFRLPTPLSEPDAIVRGPDGNMWFTEWAARIGRIQVHPPYRIDEFAVPGGRVIHKMVVGSDRNLWFTDPFNDAVGRIVLHGRTAAPTIAEFHVASGSTPAGLTNGPDGALWLTEAGTGRIGRLSPRHPEKLTEFRAASSSSTPLDITVGRDGGFWFTEVFGNAIGHLRLRRGKAPVFTECPVPDSPYFIASGPDGNLWFTEFHDPGIKIGRLRP